MNLFAELTSRLDEEEIRVLLTAGDLRLERIVSTGQASPAGFWYDQEENEWIAVLQGWGIVEFADGTAAELRRGDTLLIPAHVRHRVQATSSTEPTVWLALFYR